MLWLRNKDNGNIYTVDSETPEYDYLRKIMSSVDKRPLYEELGLQEVLADQPNLPYNNMVLAKYVGPVTVAGDTVNNSLGLAPADGTLLSCVLVTAAAQVGQATNFRTITLFDDGTPANATAAYAQIVPVNVAQTAFNAAAVATVPGTEFAMTIGTAAVNNNDILRVASVPTGTGMTFGDFVLLATFSRKT